MEQKEREKVRVILAETINDNLYRMIISKPLADKEITKIVVRPVMLKGKMFFQETSYVGTKVFHENFDGEKMQKRILEYMTGKFGQAESECADKKVIILANKKGTVTIRKKNYARRAENDETENVSRKEAVKAMRMEHNRTKKYLIQDGEPVDFLIALGVQMPDGRVVKNKYDKFKQINRYLEFIEDILPTLKKEGPIRIIDFGCGKSYLTFALYYYLRMKKQYEVDIIGLDLKKDVIETCDRLKEKLGYKGLVFMQGDIKDFEKEGDVDLVVSLHACDTATDYALAKAVRWNAKVIMAVPCCQHEVNKQITCKEMEDILKYGIIKERISALLTDAYRGKCLELAGYDTQILEFIDMEHTPKNILIRAVKRADESDGKGREELKKTDEFFGIHPTLEKLLFEENV